jgi:glutaredoxin
MVKGVIYTAPQCPHSKKMLKFLSEKGVSLEEKCILTNADSLAELIAVSKQRAVPVAVIDGEVFVGFDSRVQRRIERKLGGK